MQLACGWPLDASSLLLQAQLAKGSSTYFGLYACLHGNMMLMMLMVCSFHSIAAGNMPPHCYSEQ
jgi:hypothetical protein